MQLLQQSLGDAGNMEPKRDTLARSRLAEPVHYSSRCFVADCPIGSLAVDALCAWSEYEKDGDGLEVCLLPTRSLHAGIYAGAVDSEAVATAMPDDNVVTLFLTATQLERTLSAAQSAAWEQCLSFEESVSWQVAGLQLVSRCSPPAGPSRPDTSLRLQRRAGELIAAGSGARVPVVTLRSALALLPTPAEPPIERLISMRHILTDYLQAHSPLNYSREAKQMHMRIQHDPSCGSSACGPAAALDTPILRPTNSASALSTVLLTLAMLALLCVAALALTLWRRRRARQAALASPPGSGRRNAVEASPEFTAQARVVDERVPLKSGSTRLTSSKQLGQ